MSGDEQEQYVDETQKPDHGNCGRLRSGVWNHFTLLSRKNCIAACNYCNNKLSFKTTVSNLKKHMERKHSHIPDRLTVPQRPSNLRTHRNTPSSKLLKALKRNYSSHIEHRPSKQIIDKSKLTDLGGLEGLVLNIIGEDGETETIITDHVEVNQEEIYTQEVENDEDEISPSKEFRATKSQQMKNKDPSEQARRSRIMDLQLECLEIKKYHMQLEALMLEQQLNIRRSIFTEPLHCPDTFTRGIQTDVGGENTRVFYLTDSKGSLPRRHLFAMQDFD